MLFAQGDTDRSAVGTVFQFLSGHDLFDQGQQLFFVAVPAGFDGSFAGNGVQNLVPNRILTFPATAEQIRCDGFHGLSRTVRRQIHGNLPKKDGIITKFVDLKSQFQKQIPIGQQLCGGFRGKTNRLRCYQQLRGNGLLVTLELVK